MIYNIILWIIKIKHMQIQWIRLGIKQQWYYYDFLDFVFVFKQYINIKLNKWNERIHIFKERKRERVQLKKKYEFERERVLFLSTRHERIHFFSERSEHCFKSRTSFTQVYKCISIWFVMSLPGARGLDSVRQNILWSYPM